MAYPSSMTESAAKAKRLRKAGKLTPLKAIRLHCLDCSGYVAKDVKDCTITDCELYDYRMGRNPKRTGIGSKTLAHDAKTNAKSSPLSYPPGADE